MSGTEQSCTAVSYYTDLSFRIVSVGGCWSTSAAQSEANELTPGQVVGQSLWKFIAGEPMRNLYQEVLDRVVKGQRPVTLPFRCDSPTRRQWMLLTIASLPQRELSFVCQLVRVEPRPAVALLDIHQARSQEILTLCSWCKRVKVRMREWIEVEEAVALLGLEEKPIQPQLLHGLCPDCRDEVHQRVSPCL